MKNFLFLLLPFLAFSQPARTLYAENTPDSGENITNFLYLKTTGTPPNRLMRSNKSHLTLPVSQIVGALSLSSISATSPIIYTAGVFSIQTASASQAGYLPSADWTLFNSKSPGTINSLSTATSGTVSGNTTQQNEVLVHDAGTTLTLTMAMPTSPVNGQLFSFSSAAGITTLTLSTGTGTILNAITSLAVGGSATYVYYSATNKWYKIR